MVGAESKKGLEGIFLGHTAESVVEKSLIPVWVEGPKASEEIAQILVPTDLSENSRNAILKSIDWARHLNARLLFQHVMENVYIPSFSLIDPQDYEQKMKEIAEKNFEEFLKTLPLKDIQYDTHLSQGEPASEITKLARKNKVGLIMLSTHGRTGLGYRLLGSVAKKVLRHSSDNVLLVRPDTIDFSWLKKEILATK
jgi:nucleotide-binding universal stress UspA family protein